jgi:histidinol-phosphate aminotransferase
MKRPVALASYQWPPSNEVIAEKVGLDPRAIIRFDGNVAATPPASARPGALARALADVNEYDRGRYFSLRAAIAERHGVSIDQVALGAGSDEFIVLLTRLFAEGGTVATVPAFSYSMYPFAAAMAGATVVADPTDADLVFVCRPNNPTGELPEIPDVRTGRRSRRVRHRESGTDRHRHLATGAALGLVALGVPGARGDRDPARRVGAGGRARASRE